MAEQKKIVGASHSPNYGTRNQPRTKANKVHNSSTCHEAGSIEDLPPFSEHVSHANSTRKLCDVLATIVEYLICLSLEAMKRLS